LDTLTWTQDSCSAVYLSGTGLNVADCSLSVASVTFDTTVVGSTDDETLMVYNVGVSPCDTLELTISETCDTFSVVSGSGAQTLVEGDSLEVILRFSPIDAMIHVCTLQTGCDSCLTVPMLGVGSDAAECSLGVASITFDTLTSYTYADTSFYIYNTAGPGGSALTGTVALATGTKFSLQAGGGAFSIDAGDSLLVTVRFSPTAVRAVFDTITTGASCDNIPLEGTLYMATTAWYKRFLQIIDNHIRR